MRLPGSLLFIIYDNLCSTGCELKSFIRRRSHSQPVRLDNRSWQAGFIMGDNPPGVIDTLDMANQILCIPVGTDGQDEVNRLTDGCRIVAVRKKGDDPAG